MKKKIYSHNSTARIEAFSDGVFAIAITLLILEIHVPVAKEGESLLAAIFEEWASFLALLIGFFTLLVCWINHHYMFSVIKKCDSPLSLINGFKLLVVTITPFATALLSKNIQTPDANAAMSIYFFNFTLMGTAMTCIWLYAKRKGFIQTETPAELSAATRLYIFACMLSTAIWLISYVNVIGSLVLFGIMFMIFIFPERVIAWQMKRNEKKEMNVDAEVGTADAQ
ncbi:MAG: TMEM175 family protein [Chitinophagales bacterium]